MFWIKFVLIAVVLLVVLVLGVEFATLNTTLVTVDYLLGKATLELAWVIVSAFAAGVVITALVGAVVVTALRWQTARLRQSILGKDHEISLLTRKVGRETR